MNSTSKKRKMNEQIIFVAQGIFKRLKQRLLWGCDGLCYGVANFLDGCHQIPQQRQTQQRHPYIFAKFKAFKMTTIYHNSLTRVEFRAKLMFG